MRILISSDKHARAAGDGAAVAARFADDGRGFAGDGRFVHRRRAVDNFAVGRNDFARANDNDIVFAQRVGVHGFDFAVVGNFIRARLRARLAQRLRLRLAAAFGDGFGEIREQHREPKPDRDLQNESGLAGRAENLDGADGRADERDEHDGIFHHQSRVELAERVAERGRENFRVENGNGLVRHKLFFFTGSARVSRAVSGVAPDTFRDASSVSATKVSAGRLDQHARGVRSPFAEIFGSG